MKNQFLLRGVENQARIDHAFNLADPKTGYKEEEDVHLWLVGDFALSDPSKPLAESLRALAETYAKEHSIFREKDYRLDPGYISLNQFAKHLSASATYMQFLKASRLGAVQWMSLY